MFAVPIEFPAVDEQLNDVQEDFEAADIPENSVLDSESSDGVAMSYDEHEENALPVGDYAMDEDTREALKDDHDSLVRRLIDLIWNIGYLCMK